jgi:hypothetical protein
MFIIGELLGDLAAFTRGVVLSPVVILFDFFDVVVGDFLFHVEVEGCLFLHL